MTGTARREQLIEVARELFAEKGFRRHVDRGSRPAAARAASRSSTSTSAARKGLYAVVVDREMRRLLDRIVSALVRRAPP